MPNKLTNVEVDERINNIIGNEYLRLSNYINNTSYLDIKHLPCGNIRKINLCNLNKNTRCIKCYGGSKKLSDSYVSSKIEKDTKQEYTKITQYKNAKEKFKIRHNLCGNEYMVNWANFSGGKRCPKCNGGRLLDNSDIDQIIKKESDGEYIRISDYINSETNFLIKHLTCGNEYSVRIACFRRGNRCKKCHDKSLALSNEEVKKVIESNAGYVMVGNYVNSKRKIKIKHTECGNIYEASLQDFKRGHRCSYCYKTKRKTNKDIDLYLKDKTKKEYDRMSEYVNNHEYLIMKHNICGHEYKVRWTNFISGVRCPKCKLSKGEKRICDFLVENGIKYKKEKTFPKCVYKSKLRYDFYIEDFNLLIEFDGAQHYRSVKYFGGDKQLRENKIRDEIKTNFAKKNNIELLRIPYWEYDNIENILNKKIYQNNLKNA